MANRRVLNTREEVQVEVRELNQAIVETQGWDMADALGDQLRPTLDHLAGQRDKCQKALKSEAIPLTLP